MSAITFNAETHTYYKDGVPVPSVTQIINAVYGSGLENAPAEFVQRAAAKGHEIHAEIENYIKTGDTMVFHNETLHFIEYAKEHITDRAAAQSEVILYGQTPFGDVCGTADLIYGGTIYDYKTSKTATTAQVRKWQMQLSFYRFMAVQMGYKIENLKILHLTDDGCREITIDYLGDDFVLETMKLYTDGKQAETPKSELQTIPKTDLTYLQYALKQMAEYERTIEPIREAIKAEMEQRGILSVKIGDVSISYVAPTTRKSFDSAKFKKDHADLYAQYQKESAYKSSIRISTGAKKDA